MAVSITQALGLRKPDNNAQFGQDDFNLNMDTLDQAVPGPVFNVKGYGAKGDDAADDRAAIQAAVAAIPASGGTLFFPRGTYRISSVIDLTGKTSLCVAGDAGLGVTYPFPSTIKAVGFPINTPMFKMAPAAAADPRLFFRDLHLDGNGSAQDGIFTSKASGPRCHRVTVRAVLRDSFHFERGGVDTSNGECVDCYSNNAGRAGYYYEGIFYRFVRAISDGGQYGVMGRDNGSNVLITESHFEFASIAAISLDGYAGGGSRIIANQLACSTPGAAMRGIHITGVLSNAPTIIGNTIGGPAAAVGQRGIGIELESKDAVVLGNTISGFDSSIICRAGGIIVIGNRCLLASTQGVRVESGGGTPILITANSILDAPASIVQISGAAINVGNHCSGTSSNIYQRSLQVANRIAAAGPVGAVSGKVEIFDQAGNSLGFLPIYASIT